MLLCNIFSSEICKFMKFKLLLFFLLTRGIVVAQSFDGWFTGKASAACCVGCQAKLSFDYLYNLENHLSFGTGADFNIQGEPSYSLVTDIRIRPFGHRRAMPAVWVRGGYLASAKQKNGGAGYLNPRLSLELGNLAPVRFTLDFGAEFYDGNRNWLVGAGLLF